MKIIKFKIQGPYKIIQKKHLDKRGSFIEAYNKNSKFTYAELLDVEQKWNDLLA